MKGGQGPGYAMGVDIGGSSLRCGLVSRAGRLRRGSHRRVSVDSKGDREAILRTLVLPIRDGLRQSEAERLHLVGIGIGMCGPLDYDRGISLIQGVDKYEALYGVNLKEEFHRRLSLPDRFPIAFEVDTWAFARGEAWRGAGRGFRRVLAVTLGTGLGSAFVNEGRILTEGPGIPSPYGWIGGLPYGQGKLDDYFSRRGILASYGAKVETKPDRHIDVKDIAVRARMGDELCREVFREFGERLGGALGPIAAKFGAQCLILGGRISGSFGLFARPLKDQLGSMAPSCEVRVARSIRYSALYGAAMMALTSCRKGA